MSDVLIIEDDQWQADLIVRVFQKSKIKARVARNALEGMELIEQSLPKVIILDFFLPGPNGLTFLHELRSHDDTAKIPVVIFSTAVDTKWLEQLKPYGVYQIIDKSESTAEDLVATIKRVINE